MKTKIQNKFLAVINSNPLHHFHSARAGAFTSLILLSMALPVSAADLYWESAVASSGWATATNWDTLADGTGGNTGALVPGINDTAFFNTTAVNGARTATIAGPTSVGGVVFNNTGATTISSATGTQRTLTIDSSGVTMNLGAGAATFGTGSRSINVTIGANQTWTNNVATANLLSVSTNSIVNLGGNTLTIGGIGSTSFLSGTGTTSNIIGTGNLIKTGTGTLTFTSSSGGVTTDFTGTTTLSGGLIVLNSATALRNSTIDTTGSIVGTSSAGFRVTPTTLTLGGVSGNKNLSTVFSTTSGGYTGLTALTLNTQAGITSSYSADLGNGNGSMSLTKTGAGTQILYGTQSYSGATAINGGALVFGDKAAKTAAVATATAPGSVGLGVHVSNAAYYSATDVGDLFNTNTLTGFNLDAASGVAIDTTNAGGSFDQTVALTAARTLTKSGTGTLILSQNNTYGATNIDAGGTLQVGAGGTTGTLGSGAVTNYGALVFNRSDDVAISNVISGTGSLTKNGTNTLTSSAVNTFTGPITINGGTLEFSATNGGNNVYGSTQININGASTLRVSGTAANIPMFAGKNYTFDSTGGGKIELGAGGNYDAGVALQPFSITTQGGAQNTIKIINDGVSGSNGFNLGGSVATFDVALGSDATSDLTVTPIISNNGSILKTGTGRLTLTGANTYGGSTTITGGTLTLGASGVIPDASPVSLGTATLNAATTGTESAGTLDVTGIATINLGTGAQLAFISGTATWAGSLNITGAFVSGSSLNFGSSSGLTSTQLAAITLNGGGGPFTLDGSGFLESGAVSGYAAWKLANSTTQAGNLDHDNDGVSNGVEYFLFGTGDTTGFTAPLPGVINTAGVLSVTWIRNPSFTGFPGNYGSAFLVETSATLANPWTPVAEGVGAGFVEISGNNVKYTFPAGTKDFARLKVMAP